jgi:hypothetical protein
MRVMILMILGWMASNAGKRGSWAGRYEVHTCVGVLVCRSCGSFTIRTRNSKAVGGLWLLLQGYLIIHPADHLAEESTMPNPHLNQLK